jgi:hypothetical protein
MTDKVRIFGIFVCMGYDFSHFDYFHIFITIRHGLNPDNSRLLYACSFCLCIKMRYYMKLISRLQPQFSLTEAFGMCKSIKEA